MENQNKEEKSYPTTLPPELNPVANFIQQTVHRILSTKGLYKRISAELQNETRQSNDGIGMGLFLYMTAMEPPDSMPVGSLLYFNNRLSPLIEKIASEEEKKSLFSPNKDLSASQLAFLKKANENATSANIRPLENLERVVEYSLSLAAIEAAKQEIFEKSLVHSQTMKAKKAFEFIRKIDENIYYPFQSDYSDYFGGAVYRAEKTEPALNIQDEKYPDFTHPGYSIKLPKLNIYVLQSAIDMPFHGTGDIAVLEDPATGAYIALYGERMKNWLDRGPYAFALPSISKLGETVQKLFFDPWNEYSSHLKQASGDDSYAYMDALAKKMRPLDLQFFTTRFVEPHFDPREINKFSQGPFRTSSMLSKHRPEGKDLV